MNIEKNTSFMNKKRQQDQFKKATPFFMNLKKAAPFFMNMKKAAPFFTNIKNDPIFHIKNNKANLKKRASTYFKKRTTSRQSGFSHITSRLRQIFSLSVVSRRGFHLESEEREAERN